ncbi:MAG: Flp pilus assembly protein CpaB [bacterium]|nr:Flp pilus assembly protein CpaB [bacterium]
MATASRFGASPSRSGYNSKVRLLIASLLGVIVILVGTIVYVINQMAAPKPETAPEVAATPVEDSGPLKNMVKIVVAAQRIEEGQKITPDMLGVREEDFSRMPSGAWRDINMQHLIGKYATAMIAANMPILKEQLADAPPSQDLEIPAGYRAVTITVDARTGVEGWAKPNSRVDVNWTFVDSDKKTKVHTIVRFVKILSVGGATNSPGQKAAVGSNQPTTVTLLVTEEDARKIELARNLGSLSLALVGNTETPSGFNSDAPSTIDDILGKKAESGITEDDIDGVVYLPDPDTGKQIKMILVNGKWVRDKSY